MNYVYVPYRVDNMVKFSNALVSQKNVLNYWFGRYCLIEPSLDRPLKVVGWGDRLYTLAHGSSVHSGVCVDAKYDYVTGEDFSYFLIKQGLRNTMIDVRLWTCFGGVGVERKVDWGNPDGMPFSFALRVAQGFRNRNYTSVTVVGYTKLVNITEGNLKAHQGHKVLQTEGNNPIYSRVTKSDKVYIKVCGIIPTRKVD